MNNFKHLVTTLFLMSVFVLTGCGGGGGEGSGGSAVSGGGEGSGGSGVGGGGENIGGGGLAQIKCTGGGTGGVGSIVGSWYAVGDPSDPRDLSVITFFPDGTYTIVTDVDVVKHPDELVGIERGTYTWDATTGDFTPTVTVDTNGQAGLDLLNSNLCVAVNGDKLTLQEDAGVDELTRAVNLPNSIVGSWYYTDPATPADLAVFTFFSDGTYTLADDGSCLPTDTNCGGQDGIERGTYTFNSSNFTTTCPIVNTDGEWGLSHPTPGNCTGIQATIAFSNNGNTVTITDSNGPFVLNRIVP